MSGAHISSAETLQLARAVASDGEACNSTVPCVRHLDAISLDGTPVGDAAAAVLADALSPTAEPLQSNVSLELGAASIGAVGAKSFADALGNQNGAAPSMIVSLTLDWNERVGDDGARALGTALLTNVALQYLSLARCGIRDSGASRLALGLSASPPSLSELRLEGNTIGPAGARDLGTALRTNVHLRVLDMALNPVGARGAAELARGLKHNAALRVLSLSGCGIGDDGAEAIATMLRTNVGLQHLNLQGNKIGQRGALALASALRINRDLRWLNLQLNHIGSAAAAVLLDSMQNGEAASKGGGGLDALLLEHNMVLGGLSMGSRAEISEASGAGRTDAGHTVDVIPREVIVAARGGVQRDNSPPTATALL